MSWIQALTIIATILVPTISGFAWMIHRMDQKFDGVDAKFDKVDAKFDKVDAKFDKVDAELGKINDKITSLELKMNNLDLRVGFIERLFEMVGGPFKIVQRERTEP